VDIFLPSGKRLKSFYTANSGVQSQILGLAVDWVGKIYVSDSVNASVKVFDDMGKYLYWFPRPLPGMPPDNAFIKPVSLYSTDKKLYVTDIGDSSVKIYSTDGNFITKFGGAGKGNGQFSYLNSTALNGDEMLVTDSNNHRVQILDHQGKFKSFLNMPGGKNDWLLPRGIAVDGFGRIHVVDNFANKINVFDPDKKYLFSYPEEDSGDTGSLDYPNGITIDKDLRLIYVSDSGNDRIIVWGY
jgi:DNA-binding beta-propeller fold protein YncE